MGSKDASRADVARLLGRVAFGATKADLDTWAGRPYAELVEHLLTVPSLDGRPPQADEPARVALERVTRFADTAQLWWLERMRTSPWPLEERMVLFLHDHFATAWSGDAIPDIGDCVIQNQTLRRHALGSFRRLTEAIAIDSAMLYYLTGYLNSAGKPNENFARELFELFTLGVSPQVYGEPDIREAARCFTGWTVNGGTREPVFQAELHDTGTKHVLGRDIADQGDREYLAVVDAALAQPVAPRFLAWKLVSNFAYRPEGTDLLRDVDPLVVEVADALGSSWDLRNAMRTLMLSDRFRHADAAAGRQSVRQPIEVVVHLAKCFGTSFVVDNAIPYLARMGQLPFAPPNVSGWPVGEEWLSPTTLIARYDHAMQAFNARNVSTFVAPLPASSDLAGWAATLGLPGLSSGLTNAINRFLTATDASSEAERQKGVVGLIVASPDWMVM